MKKWVNEFLKDLLIIPLTFAITFAIAVFFTIISILMETIIGQNFFVVCLFIFSFLWAKNISIKWRSQK